MRNLRLARQTLSLASESALQPYVCRACLAQATRQYHATSPRNAEPFFKRLQNSLFGSKEQKRSEELRAAARQNQVESAKAEGSDRGVKTRVVGDVVYEIADIVDPTIQENYVAASDWQGLEVVGGEAWVKQRADQGEQYTGFIPSRRAHLTDDDWYALLHHVTAEVLTLQKAGRDVMQVCNARPPLTSDRSQTTGVTISDGSGAPSLEFATPEQEGQILAMISEVPVAGQTDGPSRRDELMYATASGGTVWTNFQLNDSRVKLAILKRAMQLTGRRLPDLAISNAKTLNDLYEAFKTKEPARKLSQAVELNQLKEANNVHVQAKRRTVVDREKAVGRWKLIEEELELRGLPLFGTKYVGAKEGLGNSPKNRLA